MTSEYSLATWVGADSSNYRAGRARPVDKIVIHITSGHANAYPVAKMWQEPGHGTSAHFVIGQDSTVIQCVRLIDTAQHAHDANSSSIGIEHCAREPNEPSFPKGDLGLPPTDAQYHASAELVATLLQRFKIPCDRKHVLGHAEADPKTTHSKCPTGAWDWSKYWPMVQAAFSYSGVCRG
jgi:N-acetyl-anhydromuramyl-L-alanine amidase AmpD